MNALDDGRQVEGEESPMTLSSYMTLGIMELSRHISQEFSLYKKLILLVNAEVPKIVPSICNR